MHLANRIDGRMLDPSTYGVNCCRPDLLFLSGGGLLLFLAFFRLRFAFEGRPNSAFGNSIANADEFDDGTDASIAEAWLGESQDAGVTTRTISEAWGDFRKQYADGLLITK